MKVLNELAMLNDEEIMSLIDQMSRDEIISILFDWGEFARPNQIEPEGDWTYWMILAGRGWG